MTTYHHHHHHIYIYTEEFNNKLLSELVLDCYTHAIKKKVRQTDGHFFHNQGKLLGRKERGGERESIKEHTNRFTGSHEHAVPSTLIVFNKRSPRCRDYSAPPAHIDV